MKTIALKIDWMVRGVLKLENSIDTRKSVLSSKRFFSSKFPTVAWELCIDKIGTGWSCTIKVWLRQIGPNTINDMVNTRYKIYAMKDSKRVDIASSTNKLENQEKLGYTGIDMELISSDTNLYLHCEVEYDYYSTNDNLKNTFRNMLENETFADCVIKVGDDVIKAHRCVLAQNSDVFQKMFESGMTETQNGEVIISDTSPECIRAMLEFFYTGEVAKETLESHFEDIFVIAHKYNVTALKYKCELIMANLIDEGNIVKYSQFISLYGASTLEKACEIYVRINNKKFLKSKEWEEVKNTCPQLGFKFLEFIIDDFNKQ